MSAPTEYGITVQTDADITTSGPKQPPPFTEAAKVVAKKTMVIPFMISLECMDCRVEMQHCGVSENPETKEVFQVYLCTICNRGTLVPQFYPHIIHEQPPVIQGPPPGFNPTPRGPNGRRR